MTPRELRIAAAVAASLGLGGTALAQGSQPPTAQQVNPGQMIPGTRAGDAPSMSPGNNSPGTQAQQVNPSQMPQGSRAGDAAGMNPGNNAPGTQAQQVNPSSMPPGSTANQAPGMNPTASQVQRSPDAGVIGGTGAAAPSGQPDVARGTAPGTSTQNAQTRDSGMAPGGPATGSTGGATGATTPSPSTAGGGRTDGTAPPAATTQHTEPRTAAAPVAGANSFTEGQARARMGDAGFNDVQELRLDEQGVWRGRATRGGSQTGVALDYQGNVVATQ